jgi:SAM-dependent methyltransferase
LSYNSLVHDDLLSRLRDRLPVNPPYEGVVAEAYDAWIPVDEELSDEGIYTTLIGEVGGPVLELGCGTGRPLLRWLAAGHEVEGIDSSADMLAILRRHAAERGLRPVLHHGDLAPLSIGRFYAAIVCPAGTFTLISDVGRARQAVDSYLDHLRPGGVLALSLAEPTDVLGETLNWRMRRTGTTTAGTTVVVHEAICCDSDANLQIAYNKIETYDANGQLQQSWLRKHHLRWWPRRDAEALLTGAGFIEVESLGSGAEWVTTGRRPTSPT